AAAHPCPARPSGSTGLEALSAIGGWPVGRLSVLAGPRGAGKRTLAQRSIAVASREGPVAYIDFPSRLDPEFLKRFNARLDHLLVVRPKSLREGMASVRVLARAGVDMICIDLWRTGSAGLDAALPR